MTPRARLRNALPAVVLGWAIGAVLAAPAAWEAARGLGGVLAHRPGGLAGLGAPGGGVALAAGARWLEEGTAGVAWAMGSGAVAMLVLSPWLLMTWLAALEDRRSLGGAALMGLRRYPRAVGVSLAVAVTATAGLALAGLLPFGAHWLLRDHPNVALHDLVFLGALVPALLLGAFLMTWHDLSRAALLPQGRGVWQGLVTGLRHTRPRLVLLNVGHRLLGLALVLAVVRIATLPAMGLSGVGLVVVLGQTATLARAMVRARWLAFCVE